MKMRGLSDRPAVREIQGAMLATASRTGLLGSNQRRLLDGLPEISAVHA